MMPPTLQASLLLLARVVAIVALVAATTCQASEEESVADNNNNNNNKLPELEIHETFKPEACPRKSKATDVLTLHYKGYLQQADGSAGPLFDSTHERGQPFTFQVGLGQVILGWDRGLVGACVGEKRKLVIPPHLGYGQAKHDQIPPGSTLVFETEILKVEDGPAPMNVFKHIDADGDKRLSRKEIADYLRQQLAEASRHGDSGAPGDPDQAHMVEEIFQHEDKDKDGYITHDEFSGPKHDHDEL